MAVLSVFSFALLFGLIHITGTVPAYVIIAACAAGFIFAVRK
jgi:hypothetical protein